MNILLLDDNEHLISDIAKIIIEQSGHNVCIFDNPKSALDVFKGLNIDVCFVDFHLGFMFLNGNEVIRMMKEIGPVKCVLMTGSAQPEELAKENQHWDYFLAKPFLVSELEKALQEVSK